MTPMQSRLSLAGRLAIVAIRGYQLLLSPIAGGACRFEPSCSAYAIEAIRRHGAGRGSVMAVRRISRCHPFGASGFDPVPPARPARHESA